MENTLVTKVMSHLEQKFSYSMFLIEFVFVKFAELRALLNKGNSVQSGSGSRQQTSGELPIGGGIMPELPKVETPTSRLLGRKGHEQLTQLRDTVKPGEIGTAISKAIQELQGKGRPAHSPVSTFGIRA